MIQKKHIRDWYVGLVWDTNIESISAYKRFTWTRFIGQTFSLKKVQVFYEKALESRLEVILK